jgi:hypothetical protein
VTPRRGRECPRLGDAVLSLCQNINRHFQRALWYCRLQSPPHFDMGGSAVAALASSYSFGIPVPASWLYCFSFSMISASFISSSLAASCTVEVHGSKQKGYPHRHMLPLFSFDDTDQSREWYRMATCLCLLPFFLSSSASIN